MPVLRPRTSLRGAVLVIFQTVDARLRPPDDIRPPCPVQLRRLIPFAIAAKRTTALYLHAITPHRERLQRDGLTGDLAFRKSRPRSRLPAKRAVQRLVRGVALPPVKCRRKMRINAKDVAEPIAAWPRALRVAQRAPALPRPFDIPEIGRP